MLEGIRRFPIRGKEVLEIGCGVGALHHALLRDGAARAYGIDISEGMIAAAKEMAKEHGLEAVTEYRQGDFVVLGDTVRPADVVVLDRVICCYAEVDALLSRSLEKCRGIYALSFPRPSILSSFIFHIPILLGRILKWSFAPFWHDWNRVLETIKRQGFETVTTASTVFWSVHVFRRV